ncbi:hypothetical protein VTK26DRAFT_2226 [Humicola hyalothermophila]
MGQPALDVMFGRPARCILQSTLPDVAARRQCHGFSIWGKTSIGTFVKSMSGIVQTAVDPHLLWEASAQVEVDETKFERMIQVRPAQNKLVLRGESM